MISLASVITAPVQALSVVKFRLKCLATLRMML
jgi:hypothetical protein